MARAIRNRLSIFQRSSGAEIFSPLKPLQASPVPIPHTVDRDKATKIEKHTYQDGSSRFVRPGSPAHGKHKTNPALQPKPQPKLQAKPVKPDGGKTVLAKPANKPTK